MTSPTPILLNCLGEPDPVLMSRETAKARGIVSGYDKSGRERLRYGTRLSPRLTHPHTLARIESAVRDDRYLDAA